LEAADLGDAERAVRDRGGGRERLRAADRLVPRRLHDRRGRRNPSVRSGVEVGDVRRGVGVRHVRLARQGAGEVTTGDVPGQVFLSEEVLDIGNLSRVALLALQVCKGNKVPPRGLTLVTPLDVGLALAQLDLTPVLALPTGAARRSPEPGATRRDKLLPGFSHDYSSAPALLLAGGRGRRPAVF